MKFQLIKLLQATLVVFALGISSTLYANTPVAPDKVVKNTLETALQELKTRRQEFAADESKLHAAIERILGPAINFELFSKAVLGNYWRTATEQQRNAFVQEFKKLLLGTYASAVFEYSDEKINYLPFSNPQKEDRVKVETEFVTKSGTRIPMTFSMNIRDDSQWRVYNIRIQTPDATIEMIPLYRSDYRDRVASKGLDAVIAEMQAKNRK